MLYVKWMKSKRTSELYWQKIINKINFKVTAVTYSSTKIAGVLGIISRPACAYMTAKYARPTRYHCSYRRPELLLLVVHAYSQAAPRIWNDFPFEIRNSVTFGRFRSALRT